MSKSNKVVIAESDRIPFVQKLGFSIGVNTEYFASGLTMSVLWMPFFNIGIGMSPTVLGIILMVFMLWDAITDPVMGYISDNIRTRWGRRRPFIVIGAVCTTLIYPLFWYIPDFSTDAMRITYLVVVGIAFYTGFTIWSMPYYGLQMELTPNYDEKTRLSAYMAVFGKLSALCGGWVLALATNPSIIGSSSAEGDIVAGMRNICWWMCGLILFCGLLPALVVKERYFEREVVPKDRECFMTSLKESFSCMPLWLLIGISFFLLAGVFSVKAVGQYVNIYYVFGGDLSAAAVMEGWKGTAMVTAGITLIPFWIWVGEQLDKKAMVVTLLIVVMVGHALNYLCMRPSMPWLQLIPAAFESAGLSAVWVFLPSMKADVADYDEMNTSRRREGSLNSFYSWFFKAAMTVSMGVGGYVLDVSGFSAGLAVQPEAVVSRMFNIYLLLPYVPWGLALFFALKYPLSRRKMDDLRNTLEEKRGLA